MSLNALTDSHVLVFYSFLRRAEVAPQPSLAIDNETLTFDSNSTETITATAKKADGTDDTITAESNNEAVATVSVNGLVVTVTGVKAGTTTITITSDSGLSETCDATVNASWHTVFFDDFKIEEYK